MKQGRVSTAALPPPVGVVVNELLQRLCHTAVRTMPVMGAGVMVTVAGRTQFLHAGQDLWRFQRLQSALQAGPCQDVYDTGQVVTAAGAAELAVWPDLAAAAEELGIGSVAAVPLRGGDGIEGVLHLYAADPEPGGGGVGLTAAAQLLGEVAADFLDLAADQPPGPGQRPPAGVVLDSLTGLPAGNTWCTGWISCSPRGSRPGRPRR